MEQQTKIYLLAEIFSIQQSWPRAFLAAYIDPEGQRANKSQYSNPSVGQNQGRNEVYGIRDQREKMGWDQGSQARDLGSQAVGSGLVVLRGDQGSSFPTENQIS